MTKFQDISKSRSEWRFQKTLYFPFPLETLINFKLLLLGLINPPEYQLKAKDSDNSVYNF